MWNARLKLLTLICCLCMIYVYFSEFHSYHRIYAESHSAQHGQLGGHSLPLHLGLACPRESLFFNKTAPLGALMRISPSLLGEHEVNFSCRRAFHTASSSSTTHKKNHTDRTLRYWHAIHFYYLSTGCSCYNTVIIMMIRPRKKRRGRFCSLYSSRSP